MLSRIIPGERKMIPEHVETKTITETIITPVHGKRDASAFRRSVKKLKDDKHYTCFVCGAQERLQVHHIAEFSLANTVNYDKLKKFLQCLILTDILNQTNQLQALTM